MSTIKYVQSPTLYQAGAGSIIGATSVVLTGLTDIYGNVLTMTDFGGKGYGTCEPDTTNEEAFTFTGITANANGTYTLTGVSTALAKSPYTETSALIRQHSGGTKVVITDNVAFWNTFGQTKNVNTWDLVQTFTALPTIPAVPVAATDAASKNYVDTTAVAGAPNATTAVKGIVELATQAELLAKTATGGTGAALAVTPDIMPSTLLSDYKADTGAADAAVITPAPAITAYVTGQRFSFKVVATNTTTTPTLAVNGLAAKTIVKRGGSALAAGDLLIGQVVEVEYDGTNMQLMTPVANAPLLASAVKFGGTGADGALAISSGTTTIDCAGAAMVVKNYTSIAITGTGALGFSNPHANGTVIILKSQGAVTITSNSATVIDLRNLGSAGGAGGAASGGSSCSAGGGGGASVSTDGVAAVVGGCGTKTWTGGTSGTDALGFGRNLGGRGAKLTTRYENIADTTGDGTSYGGVSFGYQMGINSKAYVLIPGSGGGGGGGCTTASGAGGAGGRGAGALLIECAGALNFTTGTITAVGTAGSAGTAANGSGGGGGGAGEVIIVYATLTANTGTISVTGGAGGASGGGGGAAGGAGGAGYSLVASNTEFF